MNGIWSTTKILLNNPKPMLLSFTVQENVAPPRLDKFILESTDDLSRSTILKLIKDGQVSINENIKTKPSFRLKKDCNVMIVLPQLDSDQKIKAQNLDIKIIHETKDYYVFDKPADLIVHPTSKVFSNTLVNFLLYKKPDIAQVFQDNIRPGIVHRLDKDTSGLIIVAKNLPTLRYFQELFKKRAIFKKYLWLAQGELTPANGTIDSPIAKSYTFGKQTLGNNGKDSITHYTVLKYFTNFSFLELKIDTGRTHQIRVHLEAIGHSLVGDEIYGKSTPLTDDLTSQTALHRQFLHAHSLRFICPTEQQEKEIISPLPDDLNKVLEHLKTF